MSINVGQLLIITLTLIALDATFLIIMKKYFDTQISLVQGSPLTLNIAGAIGCYICLIFIVYYFIIKKGASILEAFLLGASIYGVYEFTNYATLRDWKLTTVMMDTLWGGVLFGTTTYVTRVFDRRFL
jgi:uncharacterized membrane protein